MPFVLYNLCSVSSEGWKHGNPHNNLKASYRPNHHPPKYSLLTDWLNEDVNLPTPFTHKEKILHKLILIGFAWIDNPVNDEISTARLAS